MSFDKLMPSFFIALITLLPVEFLIGKSSGSYLGDFGGFLELVVATVLVHIIRETIKEKQFYWLCAVGIVFLVFNLLVSKDETISGSQPDVEIAEKKYPVTIALPQRYREATVRNYGYSKPEVASSNSSYSSDSYDKELQIQICLNDCSSYGNAYQEGGLDSIHACQASC